jgi:hypothetical protein
MTEPYPVQHSDARLILENYCTYKHAKAPAWLAQRPRFHVHYTPPTPPGSTRLSAGSGHHAASDPAGQLFQRHGTDRQHRVVRGGLQQDQGPVQLDSHGGFNPGKAPATLLANF